MIDPTVYQEYKLRDHLSKYKVKVGTIVSQKVK